jgi:site-specific DNA-methyltransferase (adenine-specific)
MTTRIAVGDAKKKLKLCPDDFFNTFVTSGPYWLKRDYHAGPEEIGREPTMREYVDNMMRVIDEVHRTLAPHGTFWLNLGDSYVTGEAAVGSGGLPNKSLCMLPYRIAIAMIDRGWIVRNVIIWWKPDCIPESADDRFTVDYEPLFLCTKSPNYYFKQQLRPYSEKTLKRCISFVENGETFDRSRHKFDPDRPDQNKMKVLERFAKNLVVPGRTVHSMHLDRANGHNQDVFNPAGANQRCVLRITTAGYRGAHFAVMPEELVELCLDAGCPPGGRVCDPFLGSGTTGVVARRRGCEFWGIELNPEYAQLARERITAEGNVSVPAVDGGMVLGEEVVRAGHDTALVDGGLTVGEEPNRERRALVASRGLLRGRGQRTSRKGTAARRVVAKNTLSFSCSKVMKYLRTPPDIWQQLSSEFRFTVDACASDDNHLVERYWTECEDGLKQDWTGEVVYCHPMFDMHIGKWVEKAASSRCTTVMLLPASTHTRYFHRYVKGNPRCEVRFLEKPTRGFRFGDDDGTEDDPTRIGYVKPLMVLVFRNQMEPNGTETEPDCARPDAALTTSQEIP